MSEKSSCEMQQSLHEIAAKNDVHQLIEKLSSLDLAADNVLNKEKDDRGSTALHVAAKHNVGSSHYEMVETLLNNGADPNAKNRRGRTPLWYSVRNHCNLEILNLFSRFKADFTCVDNDGVSLLTPATNDCNDLDVVKFLVEVIGLDVNHRDYDEYTPLHKAAFFNEIDSHYKILEYLLKKGADVNARDDENGYTPLSELVRKGNLKVVDLLLSYNADVHAVNCYGENILFSFDDENSDAQVLQKFIDDYGLNVNHLDAHKETPLHWIMKVCYFFDPNIEVIKCLLKNGVNINTYDKLRVTPLIIALRQIQDSDFLKNIGYLNLFIDQTDFSVVHNDVHIFDYVYYDLLRNSVKLWKWILEHLAKLQFLSIPIHPLVTEFINKKADYKNYFKKCTKELKLMSKTKPQNSWINFFNLLVDSRRKLKNYVGNQDLVKDYENNDWLKMFPIYGALLKKNVEKGLRRRKLFDKSSILLSDCLPIFNTDHLIVTEILDCILSKKDLSKFC